MIKNNKKYDITTIIIIAVSLTILAIGALFLSGFVGELGSSLREDADSLVSDGDISSENADIATDFIYNDSAKYADNYVFWFFVTTFIGLIITSMYLDFEPAIMIIIFIFGGFGVLGAWIGSEVYTGFAEDVVVPEMSKTALLMSNPYFPVFIFAGLIIMVVIMYSKRNSGGFQQWNSTNYLPLYFYHYS